MKILETFFTLMSENGQKNCARTSITCRYISRVLIKQQVGFGEMPKNCFLTSSSVNDLPPLIWAEIIEANTIRCDLLKARSSGKTSENLYLSSLAASALNSSRRSVFSFTAMSYSGSLPLSKKKSSRSSKVKELSRWWWSGCGRWAEKLSSNSKSGISSSELAVTLNMRHINA